MTPRRQLSEFLCRELLYDFATDNLDDIRRKAVEESLPEFPELEDELEAIKNGLDYVRSISQTTISEPLVDAAQRDYGIQAIIGKITMWPRWVKWTTEAAIVALMVMGSVYLIPDEYWYAASDYWTLEDTELVGTAPEIVDTEQPMSADQAKQIQEEESGGKVEEVAAQDDTNTEGLLAVNKKDPENEEDSAPEATENETETAATTPPPPQKGYVYRMYMFSRRVDEITPVIADKIRELGGSKAGEVRLGWRKSQGSYFHFTLPDKGYSEITSFVSQFGDLRISKDDHKRVMPEGVERFILWIEEINPKSKGNDGESSQSQ